MLYDKDRPADRVAEMHWIDYGLSVLESEVVEERVPAEGISDLAELTRELSREGRLAGFEVTERFYEGGSQEGLRDLERYLAERGESGAK